MKRAPIWPVLVAPLVAITYYAALKSAFSISIVSALGENTTADLGDQLMWGSHWVYRLVAEILSVGLGTFVAAGLARQRERAAAIIGGFTIALVFILAWLASRYGVMDLDVESYSSEFNAFARLIFAVAMTITVGLINSPAAEPWYQHAISALIVVLSPFIGIYVSGMVRQLNVRHLIGFIGVNRLHLIWLWFAAFCYAIGLIEPMSHLLMRPRGAGDLLTGILTGIPTSAIPVIALAAPGYYGLALLSGHKGSKLRSVTRNLLGVIVLIVPLVIVGAIQYGLLMVLEQD